MTSRPLYCSAYPNEGANPMVILTTAAGAVAVLYETFQAYPDQRIFIAGLLLLLAAACLALDRKESDAADERE